MRDLPVVVRAVWCRSCRTAAATYRAGRRLLMRGSDARRLAADGVVCLLEDTDDDTSTRETR